jgi:hypothetical protein
MGVDGPIAARRTFLLIAVPMLGTFATQRLILHHSSPDSHVFIGGYLVHHLFTGAIIQIASSFLIAFGIGSRRTQDVARGLLGFGSAMVLDEIIFLVCTDGSGPAYRNGTSLAGAAVLITLASAVLAACFVSARKAKS